MLSALQVLKPPAQEPVSVALVKRHLRLDHDADDDLLPTYIAAARAMAENYLARALITQQLLWTLAATPPANGWPVVGVPANLFVYPQWFNLSLLWQRPLMLPRQPVISVDAVSVTGQIGQPATALDPSQFGADIASAQLQVFGSAGVQPNGAVQVTFTAGYGPTPASVPPPIVSAILMTAANLYERRGDEDGGEMSQTVMALLTPYRLVSFGA